MISYHYNDFLPLSGLVSAKHAKNTLVSVVIPALNEAATIGAIVSAARKDLMETTPLIDEIIVIDGGSTDATAALAAAAGAAVYALDDIPSPDVPVRGKGTALWKSLFVARGDIIVCIDADIANFAPHFIYGLVGPFLQSDSILFVKAWYDRPLTIGNVTYENYGGRVTEILVRPILSAFVPELARIFQPLSGEYAFRKEPMETIRFSSGYGVEIGLIYDMYKQYGLDCFAQVDMDVRRHRNRPVAQLGRMSLGILQTIFRKLEMEHVLTLHTPLSDTMLLPGHRGLEKHTIQEIDLPPKTYIRKSIG
jgi:glucosyl-3-phosphoglycerate synthase